YATATGLMCLADDSGLCVDVLDGAPGVLSARYAGEPCNDLANNRKLVAALTGIALERRTAKFVCSLALATQRTVLALITDQIGGLIIDEPRGSGGFGYDPHFLLPELGKTTAELSMEHKSQLSHRGKATRRMVEWIKSYQKIITSMPYRMIDSTERA
ncbi:MAG TPA: non-canonical purine NTP pyrophosphatase, partial [Phycisphaerae bacterium]|nr:non-canonical purine NTP pyrophosphatase [Phycisphaerae bacterium]